MTKILQIDSSILGEYSVSRSLTAAVTARQQALHAGSEIVHRDLAADAGLHLADAHMAVFQGGEVGSAALGKDLALGNTYVEELFAADIIVIGAPMYNFSVPSQLKGWIDRVCVAGRTFRYGANGPEGLVTGKKVVLVSTRGGVYSSGSPMAALDHQESYMLSVLAFLGMSDVSIIRAEGLNVNDETKSAAIADARSQVAALAA